MADFKELGWVPLPNVTDATDGIITVGYTGMPSGMDIERIQVNASALSRGVIKLGGFASMTLAAYSGDPDTYTYSAEAPDGSGISRATGAASVVKAKSSISSPSSDPRLNTHDIRNGDLGIQWNIGALNSRIETHQQYDPAVRAKQIGRVIKRSAIEGIMQHNIVQVLQDNPRWITSMLIGVDFMSFINPLISSLAEPSYSNLATTAGVRIAIMQGLLPVFRSYANNSRYGAGTTKPGDFIPDVFFFSARPTRAVLAASYIASHKLVRAAK